MSEQKYNRVYVEASDDFIEIQPEYLYLTIPAKYACVYHKLMVALADLGKDVLDDCNATCKGDGRNIITCWNLFQSALAAHTTGRNKEADLFISYIEKQLTNLYNGTGKKVYNGGHYYPITPDGRLKALCSCNNLNVKFAVDLETGKLYEEFLNNDGSTDGDVFTIEDNDLTVTSENKV